MVKFFDLDAKTLGKSFLVKRLARELDKRLTPLYKRLGEERISWLVENNIDILSLVPAQKLEESRPKVKQEVQKYRSLMNLFNDDDMVRALPPWAQQLLAKHKEKGVQWLNRQLEQLKALGG